MTGMRMDAADYDGRTALHLACAEGHLHVVKLLLEQCGVPLNPKDRSVTFGVTVQETVTLTTSTSLSYQIYLNEPCPVVFSQKYK